MVNTVRCMCINQPPENMGGFFYVPGFAKFKCTGIGGGCVDADGNPLIIVSFWQKALFPGLGGVACTCLTPACLRHSYVMDAKNAAFCR